MKKLLHLLQMYATGKAVLVLFIVTMLIYLTMIFYSIPKVASFAPDLVLFDLSPTGYTFDNAMTLLETLGTEGRTTYLTTQLPLDFLYPGLFAITYSLMLTWLFLQVAKADSNLFYFSIIPLMAGLCDYIENIFIVIMITSFPNISPSIVKLASTFTILKSGFIMIFFVLLFWGLIRFAQKKYSLIKN